MSNASALPLNTLDIRELTAEAFAPYDQVIAPLHTGGQGAATHHDPEASTPINPISQPCHSAATASRSSASGKE
jgi:hypothetical protein